MIDAKPWGRTKMADNREVSLGSPDGPAPVMGGAVPFWDNARKWNAENEDWIKVFAWRPFCPNLGHAGSESMESPYCKSFSISPALSHFGTCGWERGGFPGARAWAEREGARSAGSPCIFAAILYNDSVLKGTMKKSILLVNCYRVNAEEKIRGYHEWLKAGAAGAGVELAIHDAADRDVLPPDGDFAAVIVSGSQKMVGDGEVEPGLLDFIKESRWPLLGICYGHQALARAFGCLVKRDAAKHLGEEDIFLNKTDPLFSAFRPVFKMFESHEEIVMREYDLEKEFMVLAESRYGLVEAILHRRSPRYGVQFHPEKSGELGVKLLVNFLNMVSVPA